MISKRGLLVHSQLFLLPLFALFLFTGRAASVEQPTPSGKIKLFNSTLIEAMKKADELGYSGRYKLLAPVIRDTFALSFMAGQSTGRYWKSFRKDERETLTKVYTDWTIATYAGRFDGYSGERFEIVSGSGPLQGTVTVVSKLVMSNGEGVNFHYLLREVAATSRTTCSIGRNRILGP